jgi:hypothetical protein
MGSLGRLTGAVLCAAGDHGHVHGGCHSSPFKVVLVSVSREDKQPLACVYSSKTGVWGDLISTAAPCQFVYDDNPVTLVGNALYWLSSRGNGLLKFDLDGQNLAVITVPAFTKKKSNVYRLIIQGEDDALGFAIFSWPRFQTWQWQRDSNGHAVATWVPWKTIEMHTIAGLPSQVDRKWAKLLGYDNDNDVLFLNVHGGTYMIQLKSMQSKKLNNFYGTHCYLFKSFYAPGDFSSLVLIL